MEVAGEGDGRTELSERARPAQQRTGDQRRADGRERHAPEHADARGAECARRVFEPAIGGTKRGLHRQHEKGHRHEGFRRDGTGNVEREVHPHVVEILTHQAAPTEGEANKALRRLVAKSLDVAPRSVALVAGDAAVGAGGNGAGVVQQRRAHALQARGGRAVDARYGCRGGEMLFDVGHCRHE